MPGLVIGVFDTPLVEYVGLIVDQCLVEVFGLGGFVAFNLPGFFLHACHLPAGAAQEVAGVMDRVFGQPRHLVAEHVGATELAEIRGVGQWFGFYYEDPQLGGGLGDGKRAGTGRCRVSRPCCKGQTGHRPSVRVAVN